MNSPAHALLWTGLNGRDADAADPQRSSLLVDAQYFAQFGGTVP